MSVTPTARQRKQCRQQKAWPELEDRNLKIELAERVEQNIH